MNINFIKNLKDFESFIDKPKSKYLIAFFIFLGGLSIAWDFKREAPKESSPKDDSASVDTLIPDGYVLVPIEIENQQSLDSILGDFGVVDLYTTYADGRGPSRRLAQKVKIIRAPLNPSQFAVLVREDQAPVVAGHLNPFFVMIQNPAQQGTQFEKKKARTVIISEDI